MMEEKEIKKNIDDSVKVFREILEKTYLENKKDFYGIGYHSLTGIFTGTITTTRKTNGNLRISGELPKYVFKNTLKGLPRTAEDYNIQPIVITLFNVPPEGKE